MGRMAHEPTCSCSVCVYRRNPSAFRVVKSPSTKHGKQLPTAAVAVQVTAKTGTSQAAGKRDRRTVNVDVFIPEELRIIYKAQRGTLKLRTACKDATRKVHQARTFQVNADLYARVDDRYEPDWSTYIVPLFGIGGHKQGRQDIGMTRPIGEVFVNGRRFR